MYVCNFSHTTSCQIWVIGLTHAMWCVFIVKKRPSAQLFDLYGRVRMQIFSWEDVSVYNLFHNFLCLGSTDMFPCSVSTTRRVHARVYTLKDRCLLTFWLTKSFLCVTLNIWRHYVGHQIFHRQVKTMYSHTTFKLTNSSLHATIDIWNRVWVHCKGADTSVKTNCFSKTLFCMSKVM